MLQSSAYRTKQCLRRSSSRSSSSSTRFDNSGDKGPPCGVPSSTGPTSPFFHHARGEERPDQLEHPLVGDPPRHSCHQLVVVDPVEKLFQIQINHPAAAC